jgi:hypothetical protein
MRRKDRDIIEAALWAAYERDKVVSGLGPGLPGELIHALDQGGFEIVPKAKAGRPYLVERTTVDGVTTVRTAELVPGNDTAVERAVRLQDETSARISEACRTGDWSRVTDADMLAMMSSIPGGRTYGNDDDIVGRTFSDAAGGTFTGAMRVVREVTRLRDKIRTAWAGGRGSWDAEAFARLQDLAPEIAGELDRFLTAEMQGGAQTTRCHHHQDGPIPPVGSRRFHGRFHDVTYQVPGGNA